MADDTPPALAAESPWRGTKMAWRFWEKVDRSGGLHGCWLWRASTSHGGYGQVNRGMPDGPRNTGAHRVAYELVKGPIPAGMHIDHLCRMPLCVNPAHLEAVTPRENMLRGRSPWADEARRTHCPLGHPYDEQNTILRRDGSRRCRVCTRAQNREAQARRRQRIRTGVADAEQ
jgi:hypothetical protein